MTRVLFLGGPRNGEHHDVAGRRGLPGRILVASVQDDRDPFDATVPYAPPIPTGYTLQTWRGDHAYIADGYLPDRVGCVAPGCELEARMTFTVEADGRLASREWRAGDKVEVCPKHGSDIVRAQGMRVDELPEWLRVDVIAQRLDPEGLLDRIALPSVQVR